MRTHSDSCERDMRKRHADSCERDDDMQHIAIIEEDAFHRLAHDSERALWNKPLRSANFLCMDLQVVIFEEQQRGEPQHTEVVIFDGAQVCPVYIIHVKCSAPNH